MVFFHTKKQRTNWTYESGYTTIKISKVKGEHGLVTESVAVLVVCFLLLVAFMRAKFARGMLLVLPVAVLPVFHLVARAVLFFAKGNILGVRAVVAIAFVDAIALGIACALTVFFGMKMKSKKVRNTYIILMISDSVIMAWVYIYTTLKPLLG
jgi:hypothetical protein